MKNKLKQMRIDYPGDWVFIVKEFGEIIVISDPCTYYKDCLREYNKYLDNHFDMNHKAWIEKL